MRARASAMKPAISSRSTSSECSAARSAGGLTTRQYGTGDEDPARQQLEDARDVRLQLAVAALERVEVVPEGQRRRDVDAVGHEVVEDRALRTGLQGACAGARWRCG